MFGYQMSGYQTSRIQSCHIHFIPGVGQMPTGQNPTGQMPTGQNPNGQMPTTQMKKPTIAHQLFKKNCFALFWKSDRTQSKRLQYYINPHVIL